MGTNYYIVDRDNRKALAIGRTWLSCFGEPITEVLLRREMAEPWQRRVIADHVAEMTSILRWVAEIGSGPCYLQSEHFWDDVEDSSAWKVWSWRPWNTELPWPPDRAMYALSIEDLAGTRLPIVPCHPDLDVASSSLWQFSD